MDDEEVQKQLDHMIKFIYREAEEKASEIQAKAMEEFSIEKQRIVQEERLRLMKDFEKKEKQIEVQKKIQYSNELNSSRLTVLKSREDGVQKLLSDAHKRLGLVSKDAALYKTLLHSIIVQGLIKLHESKVQVVVRKQDLAVVNEVLPSAVAEYTSKTGRHTDATVNTAEFLPPGPEQATVEGEFCSGGVVLSTIDGRIICANTLDARLSMVFEQKLPEIRTILFGESTTRKHRD